MNQERAGQNARTNGTFCLKPWPEAGGSVDGPTVVIVNEQTEVARFFESERRADEVRRENEQRFPAAGVRERPRM